MVSEAIRKRESISVDPTVWTGDDPMPYNPGSDLDRIGIDVANLQALFERYKTAVQTQFPDRHTVSRAINPSTLDAFRRTAMDIDQRLQIWADSQSSEWSSIALLQDEIPESVRKAGLHRNLCDVYPSVQVASV